MEKGERYMERVRARARAMENVKGEIEKCREIEWERETEKYRK